MSVASIRKDLHQIPELGRQEYKTKEYILNFVKDFKCEIFTPTKTSVVLYFDCQKEHTICYNQKRPVMAKEMTNYVQPLKIERHEKIILSNGNVSADCSRHAGARW